MALKLISRSNEKKEPGFLSNLGSTAAQVGTGILGSPGRLFEGTRQVGNALNKFADYVTGHEGPTKEIQPLPKGLMAEGIRENLGVSKPEGLVQEALDMSAQNLPLTLLLGGTNTFRKIGSDVAGSLAMKKAEYSGSGALGQIGAGVLGSAGFNKLANTGSKLLGRAAEKAGLKDVSNWFSQGGTPQSLAQAADKAESDYYTKAEDIGSKIDFNSKKYRSSLTSLKEEIEKTTSLKRPERKDILEKMEQYISDISGDKINVKKLTDRSKEINSLFGEPSSKPYRQYLNRIQKSMFETADDIGKSGHKNWFNAWNKAKDITKAKNYQFAIRDIFEDVPKLGKFMKSPFAWELLGSTAGTAVGGKPGAFIGAATGHGIRQAEKIYGFYNYPGAQKILKETLNNAVNRNIPAFERSIRKLNSMAEDYEKKEAEEKPKLRLVSRA